MQWHMKWVAEGIEVHGEVAGSLPLWKQVGPVGEVMPECGEGAVLIFLGIFSLPIINIFPHCQVEYSKVATLGRITLFCNCHGKNMLITS